MSDDTQETAQLPLRPPVVAAPVLLLVEASRAATEPVRRPPLGGRVIA